MEDHKKMLISNQRDWSNAHAEMSRIVTRYSEGYLSTKYAPIDPTDRVMQGAPSEYVLRLAQAIRTLDARGHSIEQLLNTEPDRGQKEGLIGFLDIFRLQMDSLISSYFLALHMEFPDWKGAPIFTLRSSESSAYPVAVVVMEESIRRLKRRVRKLYHQGQPRQFFVSLVLSPLAS